MPMKKLSLNESFNAVLGHTMFISQYSRAQRKKKCRTPGQSTVRQLPGCASQTGICSMLTRSHALSSAMVSSIGTLGSMRCI